MMITALFVINVIRINCCFIVSISNSLLNHNPRVNGLYDTSSLLLLFLLRCSEYSLSLFVDKPLREYFQENQSFVEPQPITSLGDSHIFQR